MPFSGNEVSILGPLGVSKPPWASFAGKSAITLADNRTAAGRIILAFADGAQFRLRQIRTDGASDLQTINQGSAMTGVVFRN